MIDWEHYRAEWISLCHQYQLYVITTSKHQTAPILAALKAAGSRGAGLVVKTYTDFEAAYKVCLQQVVLPAPACLPPGLHTFGWSEEPACLPLLCLLGFPGSGEIKGYQRIWDSL